MATADAGDIEMSVTGNIERTRLVDQEDGDNLLNAPPKSSSSARPLVWLLWLAGMGVVVAFIVLMVVVLKQPNAITLPSETYAQQTARLFRTYPQAMGAKESLAFLSNNSHIAGSAQDKVTADYVKARFLELGIPDVKLEEFNVLLNDPVPNAAIVQILSPAGSEFTASLHEASVPGDPMTFKEHPGPFNGYSPSADVTGELVYVNYGRVEDFQALNASGISVVGKIALARYGRIFRGNKVENAEAVGALGVIIYSDPKDDGFVKGPVYPAGPWRPPTSVQRGSVFTGDGDPLTPFYPSTPDSLRLTLDEARNVKAVGAGWALPTIPSIPIGYGDAEPLLRSLGGADVPAAWQGGLPFTYKYGPGPSTVRVKTQNNFSIKTIWNVIGTIEGSIEPDRWVIAGNHRDAWVEGAVDPSSGTAALIETARGLGQLLKGGWTPSRSIMLCSWDAEEYGLVGSAEWVEAHMNSLQDKAVAYINNDESVAMQSYAYVEATPSLTQLIYSVSKQVPQPPCVDPHNVDICSGFTDWESSDTIYSFWAKHNPQPGVTPAVPEVGLLGSGSDQTAFIAHAGVASMDMGFSSGYPVYHSVYDSFEWVSKFGDPSFEFHKASSQLLGSYLITLAEDPVLPFDFTDYAKAMLRYEAALTNVLTGLGGSDAVPPGGIQNNGFENFGMPTPGAPAATPHTLDLARLRAATLNFERVAGLVSTEARALVARVTSGDETDPRLLLKVRALNDRLMHAERAFIAPQGLPGRAWFRHVIFTPSLHDSYASTAFPAVSDAIAVGDWREAQRQLDVVVHLLNRASESLAGNTLSDAQQ